VQALAERLVEEFAELERDFGSLSASDKGARAQ
jgi:hypothetical protein